MALIENWLPPTRQNWEWIVYIFQFFPLITVLQWFLTYYPQGKTSNDSHFNIPGKWAWMTMEMPGVLVVLYCLCTLPAQLGIDKLPLENLTVAALFVIHYLYRAIIGPLVTPSMSPIHPVIWLSAINFQIWNGLSIGGYLGGFGPTSREEWQNHRSGGSFYCTGARMEFGMMIWVLGFIGNVFHDEELREIRRAAQRMQRRRIAEADKSTGKTKAHVSVDKVYVIPVNGLFRWIFYPHYLCEWIEWMGWWIMGGSGFLPARTFLINEISTMVPRALQGKRWYVKKFGKDKVAGRKAVIPGIL